jgi:hypothetical protein
MCELKISFRIMCVLVFVMLCDLCLFIGPVNTVINNVKF